MKRRTRTPEEVLEWYRNLTPQEQGRVMIDLELSTRRSRKAPVEDLEAMSLAAIELAQNPDVQARLQQALRGGR